MDALKTAQEIIKLLDGKPAEEQRLIIALVRMTMTGGRDMMDSLGRPY